MILKQLVTILVAISVLINVCVWGKRHEMLSSRAYRCSVDPKASPRSRSFWWCIRIGLDTILGPNHCADCYEFQLKYLDDIQD